MAKLVEILARDWNNWPVEPFLPVSQNAEGCLFVSCRFTENVETRYLGIDAELSDDLNDDVTRAQWEAERERILAESSKLTEADKAHIEELTAIACGKRIKEDQELWDKVAIAAVSGEMACQSNAMKRLDAGDLVRYSMAVADAFIAERAKRMKG